MTNEEAKVFLDNLKICIDEHPVVADWLVEIADRKTENSSEKPNNCEVKNYCDDCLYNDTCDSKEFFYACTSKATISKMEQVEDEPQTTDYCDVCNHKGCDNCIADGNNPYCVPSHYEPKDEPQTDCAWK